jgi:NAD-dependent deacetylase
VGLDESALRAIDDAAELMLSSAYVICLTGAGVSVESGIPPFRGPGGLWTKHGEPPMDGYQRFMEDPKGYWEQRFTPERSLGLGGAIVDAKPNSGHYALAEMEAIGVLRVLITQNIDNLHVLAGSRNLLEIHGNSQKLRCIDCGSRFQREGFDLSVMPPRCPYCSGVVVKSDMVMFGEPIPQDVLRRCFEEARRSDCILVAGTSALVHPAAGIPITVKRKKGKIIEVNITRTELSGISDVQVIARSGEALPALVEALKRRL